MCNATSKRYSQAIHPQDRQKFEALIRNLRPDAANYTMDYRLIFNDGGVVTLEETAQAVFDVAGKIKHVVGVATDVTQRKKTEDALRQSREEWIETFNLMPDLIAIIDDHHKIVRVNKAMKNSVLLRSRR